MPSFVEVPALLNGSFVLRQSQVRRESFDPTNAEHLKSLRKFLETGSWGEVQFFCEPPYTDVPMSVLAKFALHNLKKGARAAA